ncbi:MAG: ribonuclease P protein subunit [Candidatus Hodarchaeales archaeon]
MSNANNTIPEIYILKTRLIGLQCKITYCNKEFIGIIIDETKNTLIIKINDKTKTIPKENSTLKINLNNKLYEIDGKYLKGRHEDRIKHRMKRKW